jgi:hypothetical protein
MPVRNALAQGKTVLDTAIRSILEQTFDQFEFLIVDDHSTDGTDEVLSSYKDPRIRIIPNVQSPGFSQAMNIGVSEARGTYVARMDADDVSLPNRLDQQLAILEGNPDVDILGGEIAFLDEQGEVRRDPAMRPHLPGHVRWSLRFYCSVAHPTVVMRRSVLNHLGGYDSAYSPAEDHELWLRAMSAGYKIANVPAILLHYRINPTGMSHAPGSPQNAISLELSRSALRDHLGEDQEIDTDAIVVLREPRQIKKHAHPRSSLRKAIQLLDASLANPDAWNEEEKALAREDAAQRAQRLLLHGLSVAPSVAFSRPDTDLIQWRTLAKVAGAAVLRRARR